MTTFLVAYLVHAFRVMPAAAAMVVIALPLWFINGVVGRALWIQAPAFVLISSGLIAAAAFSIGGYISATRLTPGSILHPSHRGDGACLDL
jgi:hypothetical protein